jgi:GTP cyclohydrolase I
MRENLAKANSRFIRMLTRFFHENLMALFHFIRFSIITKFAKMEEELIVYQNAIPVKTACESYVPTPFCVFHITSHTVDCLEV